MDILSFAFGIVAVISLIAIGILIVMIVKVKGIEENYESFMRQFESQVETLNRYISENQDNMFRHVEEQVRNVKSYTDSRIDKSK